LSGADVTGGPGSGVVGAAVGGTSDLVTDGVGVLEAVTDTVGVGLGVALPVYRGFVPVPRFVRTTDGVVEAAGRTF